MWARVTAVTSRRSAPFISPRFILINCASVLRPKNVSDYCCILRARNAVCWTQMPESSIRKRWMVVAPRGQCARSIPIMLKFQHHRPTTTTMAICRSRTAREQHKIERQSEDERASAQCPACRLQTLFSTKRHNSMDSRNSHELL